MKKYSGFFTFYWDAKEGKIWLQIDKLDSEFEAVLTYEGRKPGKHVMEVVPSPNFMTVHEHYSFVKLPDDGYQPREFNPRAGYFDVDYMDFSAPLGSTLHKRLIIRPWLQKKDPNAAVSEPVKPIVYYVDNGAPKDVRDALIEGASWWNKAFEAAGFKNAFIVKVLPDSVDPMDIRYNVIQWVDRYTRGWSYGSQRNRCRCCSLFGYPAEMDLPSGTPRVHVEASQGCYREMCLADTCEGRKDRQERPRVLGPVLYGSEELPVGRCQLVVFKRTV